MNVLSVRKKLYTVLCTLLLLSLFSSNIAIAANSEETSNEMVIKVERIDATTVKLEWPESGLYSSYELYLKIDDGTWKKVKTVTGSSTYNYNLLPGETYNYKLRPCGYDGQYSDFTNEVSITLDCVLDTPKNLAVHQVSDNSVALSWNPVDGVDEYIIYRSTDKAVWSKIKTVSGGSTYNYNLIPGELYYYRILAFSSKGDLVFSDYSDIVAVELRERLMVPRITVTQVSANSVKIDWNSVDGADYFELYRSFDAIEWKKVKNVSSTYTYNYSLDSPMTYYYKVRAVCNNGNYIEYSYFSNIEFFQLGQQINKPDNLTTAKGGANKVFLSWDTVNSADGYLLLRNINGGDWKNVKYVSDNSTGNYNLEADVIYGYQIQAYVEAGFGKLYGLPSETVYYWNADSPIIESSKVSSNIYEFEWNEVGNAAGYHLYSADGEVIDTVMDNSLRVIIENPVEKYYITAYTMIDGIEIETGKSNYVVCEGEIEDNDNSNYRALLIGETSYVTTLHGPDNDVTAMKNILENLNASYEVYSQIDATKEEIVDLIEIAFMDATEDDVSLFYYSGHGVTGSGEFYSGALQTVDYCYITTQDLAELLSGIPGKVIVILDSCGSGATISGEVGITAFAGDDESINAEFDYERFNDGVIKAFSSYNQNTRSGELRQSKFYVLTGSAYEESSLTVQIDGIWGGLMTRGISAGLGFAYPSSIYTIEIPADSDSNGLVSLNELYSYCNGYIDERQNIQVYPSGNSIILFNRK